MTKQTPKKVPKKPVKNIQKKPKVKKPPKKRVFLDKEEIYDLYCLWKSLPPLLKKPDKAILRGINEKEFYAKMGVDDEKMLSLLNLKTQGQFANNYGVNKDTLSLWNKRIYDEGRDEFTDMRRMFNKLTKNVMLAHYNKAIRKFDPITGDLWYKVVAGFNEKHEVKHSGSVRTVVDLVREHREDNLKKEKIARRKKKNR